MLTIRPLQHSDYSQWLPLWDGNNHGVHDRDLTTQTWNRLCDPVSPVKGMAAFINGDMVGIVHYVLHPITGALDPACYMQDLYTAPTFRRLGIARALVDSLANTARTQKWARLYWVSEGKNEAVQAFYKTIGIKLDFSLHVHPLDG